MLIDQADPFENPNNPPTCVHFPPAVKRRIWFTTFHRFPIHRTRHPTAKLQTNEMKGKRLTFFFFGVQQNKEADSCLMGRRRDVMLMGKAATISDTYWHFKHPPWRWKNLIIIIISRPSVSVWAVNS